MAMICCICGKSQSGWITDYPLSTLLEYRICVKCNDIITKCNHSKQGDDLSGEAAYLKGFAIDDNTVKQYVDRLVDLCENPTGENLTADMVSDNLKKEQSERLKSIMVTSGFGFENYRITNYLGFISAEIAIGLGAFKGMLADVANVFGAESASIKNKLIEVKQRALDDLKQQAMSNSANAIIGIDLDYTMFGNSLVAVVVSGTAVSIEEKED